MNTPTPDPTQRFSNRVADYIRYRPTYPTIMIDALRQAGQLPQDQVVADIGSGTGILTGLLLDRGYQVKAVEPNSPMRQAAEGALGHHPDFTSIAGDAERTGLADGDAGAIVAAQAFHWFDPQPTRKEWLRILKPGGWVILIWNDRKTDSSDFLRAYESLLHEFATDYKQVNHKRIDLNAMQAFFGHDQIHTTVYPNAQHFDYPSLAGRLLSSSYAPDPSHPNHTPMMRRLREIFTTHAQNNTITFDYDTRVYAAQLHAGPQ